MNYCLRKSHHMITLEYPKVYVMHARFNDKKINGEREVESVFRRIPFWKKGMQSLQSRNMRHV